MMSDAVRAMLDNNASASTPTAPLAEYLAAEEDDPNLWWRLAAGHQQNLFEEACADAQLANDDRLLAAVMRRFLVDDMTWRDFDARVTPSLQLDGIVDITDDEARAIKRAIETRA